MHRNKRGRSEVHLYLIVLGANLPQIIRCTHPLENDAFRRTDAHLGTELEGDVQDTPP